MGARERHSPSFGRARLVAESQEARYAVWRTAVVPAMEPLFVRRVTSSCTSNFCFYKCQSLAHRLLRRMAPRLDVRIRKVRFDVAGPVLDAFADASVIHNRPFAAERSRQRVEGVCKILQCLRLGWLHEVDDNGGCDSLGTAPTYGSSAPSAATVEGPASSTVCPPRRGRHEGRPTRRDQLLARQGRHEVGPHHQRHSTWSLRLRTIIAGPHSSWVVVDGEEDLGRTRLPAPPGALGLVGRDEVQRSPYLRPCVRDAG